MQNVDSRRLRPKLNHKVYLLSNTQNSIVINTEKIWRYQKQVLQVWRTGGLGKLYKISSYSSFKF